MLISNSITMTYKLSNGLLILWFRFESYLISFSLIFLYTPVPASHYLYAVKSYSVVTLIIGRIILDRIFYKYPQILLNQRQRKVFGLLTL